MKKSEFLFTFGRILNDGVMIFLALLFAYFLRMRWFGILDLSPPTTLFPLDLFYAFAFKIAVVLIAIMALNGRYKFYTDEKIWDEMLHVFWTYSAGMALVLVVFFFSQFTFFSRFIFGMAWVVGLIFILCGRIGLRKGREFLHQKGYGKVGILILGTGGIASQAIDILRKNPKYKVLGVLSDKPTKEEKFEKVKIVGAFKDFEKLLKELKPDEVLIASETQKITSKLVRIAHINHVKFRFLPDELGLDLAAVTVSTLGNLPLITLQSTKLGRWGYVIKSGIDILAALVTLILTSPVFAIVAWKIWREDRSAPIFYKSKRVGKGGKEFYCLKFRTMIPNADEKKKELLKKNERKGGVLFKMEKDPRITKLGKVLRKWSLDELPQLLNVLKGDMSLIGPRPHLPEEVEKYPKDDLRVLSIKPGITGFAQINGRSSLSFEEEMNYELFYIKNWSFRLDVIIFIKSVLVVVKQKDVS